MKRPFSFYDPADGRLFLSCSVPDGGDYLVWVDDVLIARVSGGALRQGLNLSPTYRLHAPGSLRLQPTKGIDPEIRGIIWIVEPTVSARINMWIRGRSVTHRRALFLACGALPQMAQQAEIVAGLGRVFGDYFDSFATAVLVDGPTAALPDANLTVDVQLQCDISGMVPVDVTGILGDSLAAYAPAAVIPLDAAAEAYAAQMRGIPVLAGPWLERWPLAERQLAQHGMRWMTQGGDAPEGIEMTPALTLFAEGGCGGDGAALQALLGNRMGLWQDDVLPDARQTDLITRLAELGQPATVLIGRGPHRIAQLRAMRNLRFACLETAAPGMGRRYRAGLPVESFDWAALQGRLLVYLGEDEALDRALSAECRRRAQAYRSAFSVIYPGAAATL